MHIALKVDVDTFHGTLHGVPALLRLFDRYAVKATFLFSVGPDHTGRALRRIFRPGFLRKVQRTSVVSHYGFQTLLYGVLLPGPHIGQRAGSIMRDVQRAGHEVGLHCYDHVRWQDYVAQRDIDWTTRELMSGISAFKEALGRSPATLGAAGWQINPHVLALEQQLGFHYASDCRGRAPFLPEMAGVRSQCVQLPTTLPTLDECLGRDGIDHNNVAEFVQKALFEQALGHVYTLHAELEGRQLLSVMEQLLQCWQADGHRLGSLGDLYRSLDHDKLPRHAIDWGEVEGRSGTLAVESIANKSSVADKLEASECV